MNLDLPFYNFTSNRNIFYPSSPGKNPILKSHSQPFKVEPLETERFKALPSRVVTSIFQRCDPGNNSSIVYPFHCFNNSDDFIICAVNTIGIISQQDQQTQRCRTGLRCLF